jgi:hypothetical protein
MKKVKLSNLNMNLKTISKLQKLDAIKGGWGGHGGLVEISGQQTICMVCPDTHAECGCTDTGRECGFTS